MHRRLIPLAAALGGLLIAVPVLASHVQPQFVSRAASCGPLEPGTVELIVEVPQGLGGTVTDEDFTAAVTLDGSVGNGSVQFQDATLPVKAVFIAGTEGGNLYAYEEPVTEDDGLVAPDGQPISGVSFCYVSSAGASGSAAPSEGAAEASASADVAGASEGAGASDGGGASEEPNPPATDTEAVASPLGSVVLVAVGLGLLSIGLVLSLPKRAPVRVRTRRPGP